MEYCEGGDLDAFIKTYGGKKEHWETYQKFIESILKGLAIFHGSKQLHRDIKPPNILLQGKKDDLKSLTTKIGDVGLARNVTNVDNSNRTLGIGTPHYWAPEQIRYEEYSLPADMFAAGIVFHELISGKHPFDKNPGRNLANEPHPLPAWVPEYSRSLVMKLLRKGPEERPTCE